MTATPEVSRRDVLAAAAAVGAVSAVPPVRAATSTLSFGTASDWDNASSESGVGHYSESDTDYSDAGIVQQAYDYASFGQISPTPVAAYPLHEDSGSTAYDKSGNDNDGTVSGATLGQTGIFGTTAYGFDGTNDEVEVPNDATLNNSSFTLTVWINGDDFSSNDRHIVNKASGSSTGYIFLVDSSSTPRLSIGDGSSYTELAANSSISTGSWVFLAATYDGSDGELFIDGSSDKTGSLPTISDDGGMLHIGRHPSDAREFDGTIADLRLYDSVLSDSDIQTLYDVVNTAGSLTTAWQAGTGKATSIDTTATVPSNTSLDVTVEQDQTGDGSADASQTVAVDDGTNTYTLSGFSDVAGDYRLVVEPGNSDVTATAELDTANLTLETSGSSSGSTFEQTIAYTDESGLFPRSKTTLTVGKWAGWDRYDHPSTQFPALDAQWSAVSETKFDAAEEAVVDLTGGETYRLTVHADGHIWERYGFVADETQPEAAITIPEPPAVDGDLDGPLGVAASPCALGSDDGVLFRYYDDAEDTSEYGVDIDGRDGHTYQIRRSLGDDGSYYHACVSGAVTNYGHQDDALDWEMRRGAEQPSGTVTVTGDAGGGGGGAPLATGGGGGGGGLPAFVSNPAVLALGGGGLAVLLSRLRGRS